MVGGVVADDHGNTPGSATEMLFTEAEYDGKIEVSGDTD